MSPIFNVPKRRQNTTNKDTQIVGGTKIPENSEEPRVLSSSQTKGSPVQIQSKQNTEEIQVQSHKRSRPKRDK